MNRFRSDQQMGPNALLKQLNIALRLLLTRPMAVVLLGN